MFRMWSHNLYLLLGKIKIIVRSWAWSRTPLTHSEGKGRQISEFEDSLVYRVSSRTARATQKYPVLRKQTN